MKKMILFIAAMLLVGTTAQATDQKLSDQSDRGIKRYPKTQPIIFVENNVTYYIYSNGEIDFKTPLRKTRQGSSTRTGYNNTAPGYSRSPINYNRFAVKYDAYGKLRQVGNTTIRYNQYNKVRRVGSVFMKYNNRGRLIQVGGLHIYYGKKGTIAYKKGTVHTIVYPKNTKRTTRYR